MPFPTANRPGGPISSSAPPMYRAKKKKPGAVDAKGRAETAGEVQPPGQNSGRLTGPPVQMGPGQGSMFANGRMPQGQMQGNLPRTPNYPTAGPGPRAVRGQAQGTVPPTPNYPVHMADGGGFMGAPQPIGGMPDDDGSGGAGPVPGDGSDPTQQGGGPPMGGGAIVKPEAVAYHDDPQMCSGCMHMDQNNQCEILAMAVSPQGGCNAFEAGQGGGDQGLGGPTGASMTQNDDGTSGGPSLG